MEACLEELVWWIKSRLVDEEWAGKMWLYGGEMCCFFPQKLCADLCSHVTLWFWESLVSMTSQVQCRKVERFLINVFICLQFERAWKMLLFRFNWTKESHPVGNIFTFADLSVLLSFRSFVNDPRADQINLLQLLEHEMLQWFSWCFLFCKIYGVFHHPLSALCDKSFQYSFSVILHAVESLLLSCFLYLVFSCVFSVWI